jgi:hypothetical protein
MDALLYRSAIRSTTRSSRLRLAAAALLGAAMALVSACAGKPTINFAYDHAASFQGLKTYGWFDDPNFQMPGGNSIVDGRFVDEHVRAAVEKELAKKGYTKSDSTPDIYVSYSTNAAGVASQDKFGRYAWWSQTLVGGTKYQKEGSLVLDVRDRDKKLVWRGFKQAIVGTNPEALARDIDDAVDDLLGKFPPKPAAS